MLGEDEDESLLAAARAGDRDAFGALFDRYRDYAFSIAFDILRDEHEAGDVTQDTFIKVLTRIHQVRGGRVRSWLARIVVHTALDVVRRRRPSLEAGADLRAADNVSGSFEQRDSERRVRDAIRTLGPRLRATVLLRYVAGWSYERIARRLGISSGTVASRLSRAHNRLKERLEASGGGR